jgi:hypothetical protein
MFTSNKTSKRVDIDDTPRERREDTDRRTSTKETRFPFIDDNSRLVMKNRRNEDRRASDASFKKNPLKVVNKLLKR